MIQGELEVRRRAADRHVGCTVAEGSGRPRRTSIRSGSMLTSQPGPDRRCSQGQHPSRAPARPGRAVTSTSRISLMPSSASSAGMGRRSRVTTGRRSGGRPSRGHSVGPRTPRSGRPRTKSTPECEAGVARARSIRSAGRSASHGTSSSPSGGSGNGVFGRPVASHRTWAPEPAELAHVDGQVGRTFHPSQVGTRSSISPASRAKVRAPPSVRDGIDEGGVVHPTTVASRHSRDGRQRPRFRRWRFRPAGGR